MGFGHLCMSIREWKETPRVWQCGMRREFRNPQEIVSRIRRPSVIFALLLPERGAPLLPLRSPFPPAPQCHHHSNNNEPRSNSHYRHVLLLLPYFPPTTATTAAVHLAQQLRIITIISPISRQKHCSTAKPSCPIENVASASRKPGSFCTASHAFGGLLLLLPLSATTLTHCVSSHV